MMALLRSVSLRHLVAQPLRTLLMVAGIALGVAVFVAVQALNETALAGFAGLSKVAAGDADLILEGGHAGFGVGVVGRLKAAPEVAAATPLLLSYAKPAWGPERDATRSTMQQRTTRRVMVLGMDLLGAGGAASAQATGKITLPNPGALALRPDAALAPRAFLEREGLKIGSQVPLYTAVGRRRLVIVGSYEAMDMVRAMGGDVLLMSLPAAQLLFARPGKIDRVAIKLKPGHDLQKARASLAARCGPGLRLSRGGQSGGRAQQMLAGMTVGLGLASLLALLIGQFLIYNTMSIAIVRRRPEIGILRALGATKRQLGLLWLMEAAVYGLLGALVGLILGLVIAQGALGLFAGSISMLYEAIDLRVLRISPRTVLLGLASGPIATVLAALLPVREALRIAPVEAARRDLPARDPRPLTRRLALAGLLLLGLAASLALGLGQRMGLITGAGCHLLLVLGFALCTPWGVLLMAKLARPLLIRLLGPAGLLAGDNLVSSPLRAGVTVSALMVAVGGVLSISALVGSLRSTVDGWLDGLLTADLFISASAPIGTQDGTLLAQSFEAKLRALKEVAETNALRFVYEEVEGRPVLVVVMEGALFGHRAQVPTTAGDISKTPARLASGKYTAVSENFARHRGKKLGDRVRLETPKGPVELEICLIVIDYSSEHGSLFLDWDFYERYYGDHRISTFNVWLDEGLDKAGKARVAEDIRRRWSASHDLFVLENESFKRQILVTVEQSFQISYAMELVAICIALLGVVNTLFAAVLERTREIGVLRAPGASRGQVRRAVIAEAFLLGGVAGGFGITCGAALGYVNVVDITAGAFGWQIPFHFPLLQGFAGAGIAALLSACAGVIPASRAAGMDIVTALSYE